MSAGGGQALPWMLSVALLGPSGCSSVRITLRAEADTNHGRPLQVLIRSVDEQTYRGDSYAAVARLVITPDGSMLRQLVLDPRPGTNLSFWVKAPPDRPLALYFLYTAPTLEWKMLLLPKLPWSLTVPLRRGGIAIEEVRERSLYSSYSSPPSPPSSFTVPSPPAAPSLPSLPSPPSAPSLPAMPGTK